jgi:chromosome segregation ATPase
MDASTIPRWLTEHWPSLLNVGLLVTLLKTLLEYRKLRSDIRHTDAQTTGAQTDNLVKEVGGVTSVIAVYKSTAFDVAEKYAEVLAEVKSLRAQVRRRDKANEHLLQEIEILREMKNLPPAVKED